MTAVQARPASGQLTLYHIPVCPFCQRLEILLTLKGIRDKVRFYVIDITQPRPSWLLEMTRGSTSLPVLETEDGKVIKESLIIMRYLEARFTPPAIAQQDLYRHAVEEMLIAMEGEFTIQGYRFVMNQDPALRDGLARGMEENYARLNDFLIEHHPEGVFLFEDFSLAEAVYTPLFMRFWFLDYYEGFDIPHGERFTRVRAWRDACLSHPAAQQVTREEIVKLYYDYAMGAGDGTLLPGRQYSSFVFEPHWRERPWPPRKKYQGSATDAELGLIT